MAVPWDQLYYFFSRKTVVLSSLFRALFCCFFRTILDKLFCDTAIMRKEEQKNVEHDGNPMNQGILGLRHCRS
jgi:hypothetical protein